MSYIRRIFVTLGYGIRKDVYSRDSHGRSALQVCASSAVPSSEGRYPLEVAESLDYLTEKVVRRLIDKKIIQAMK